MKKLASTVAGMLAAAVLAPAAMAQAAEPVYCTGTLSDQILEDVVVEYGEECTLSRVIVLGSVTGDSYSRSITLDSVTVRGDVRAVLARQLTITNSAIGGDLRTTEISGTAGLTLSRSAVGGATTINYTRGPVTLGDYNVFRGAVSVRGGYGGGTVSRGVFASGLEIDSNLGVFSLSRNIVRGALDCEENSPAPVGSANLAGQKLGQCASV